VGNGLKRALTLGVGLLIWSLISWRSQFSMNRVSAAASPSKVRRFEVSGVVQEVKPDRKSIIVEHQPITNYMDAMTMPFRVKDTNQLRALKAGDRIRFRLLVKEDESWIDHVQKIGESVLTSASTPSDRTNAATAAGARNPLLRYAFTNEFGKPATLDSFRGQALGITFFFTRCPIPEYCPRLSRNFEEASNKLIALPNGPTNWHFLSVSIDPSNDTPAVLRAYAGRYHYNSNHWTFLTGSVEKVRELARLSGVSYEAEGSFFNHSFRTLIIDPNGALRKSFPVGGNLSDQIAEEMIEAARAEN
jgi:protein SCO1/2